MDSISPQLKQAYLDLWSVRPSDASAAWSGTNVEATPWDVSAFYKQPLIDFGPRGSHANLYTPIRTAFMVSKAQLADSLWIAADRLPEEERLSLFRNVGTAFEATARRRVEGRFARAQLLTEDDLRKRRRHAEAGEVCDLVVVYREEWVAFEFVRHTLTRRTLTVGDYADLMKDLQAGAVKKLRQIDSTVWRLLADVDMPHPSRVFPVVVVGGQLSINPVTWQAILSTFASGQPRSLTVDGRCMHPAILDLVDLRLAFVACDQLGKTLPQVLTDFLASSLAAMPFIAWLEVAYRQVVHWRATAPPTWLRDACKWSGLPQSPP